MRTSMPQTMAFALAGGKGTRLFPLTADRCKPSVPFNANYRVADFVTGNLASSGVQPAYLLAQHEAQGLIDGATGRDCAATAAAHALSKAAA